MTENLLTILLAVIAGLGGSLVFFKYRKLFDFEQRKKEAQDILEKGKTEAAEIFNETKSKIEKNKASTEVEIKERRARTEKVEEKLKIREEAVRRKDERNKEIKKAIEKTEEEMRSMKDGANKMEKDFIEKLAQKTGQKPEEVRENIIESYTRELEVDAQEKEGVSEEYYKENAEKIARRILVSVMQRLTSPTSVESRAVQIKVPKDHIKGKIVGRDGKNIEEFEESLGVDVIFNDLPQTISVSCFNLVQRRIAQRAIERLIQHRGDIDSKVIHKAIEDGKKDTENELFDIGKKAVNKMNLKISNRELLTIIGRLQYRTSYGQNILRHSMEVAWVASMLGSELGLNVETCRVGGFLHDLGKAIDQDPNVKDAHDHITKELMEKFGFSPEEVHAAWTHHEAIPIETAEGLIVRAADAVSAGRPGARQESLEKYSERLKALEKTVNEFEGIKKSFAISAGREIRVIVDPDIIKDEGMKGIAHGMATKIEETLAYPGKIKVNLIRRTKYIETAH